MMKDEQRTIQLQVSGRKHNQTKQKQAQDTSAQAASTWWSHNSTWNEQEAKHTVNTIQETYGAHARHHTQDHQLSGKQTQD